MEKETTVPKFVSIVTIALGAFDLLRGFMHTILLEYAATNIAGLNLTAGQGADLLQLMGAFGISNYLTGIMLIILGWKLRPFALMMLGLLPIIYAIGAVSIRHYTAPYEATGAAWGGAPIMRVYLIIAAGTFVVGSLFTWVRSRQARTGIQRLPA
jgi:hypothetical protein